MDTRVFALVLGALFLVFNVIWALVRGQHLVRSYAKAELPPPLSLAWGTALIGAVALYVGSLLSPSGGAYFDPAMGAGLPTSGVSIISVGWIALLVDARIRLLPTEVIRIIAIEVIAGWLIFGFDTGFGLVELIAPLLSAAIWLLPVLVGQRTGGVGTGDLRLAPVLGFALGTSSLFVAILGLVIAFVAAGAHGIYVGAKTKDRRARFAFGPYLFAGAWAAWVLGAVGPMLFV